MKLTIYTVVIEVPTFISTNENEVKIPLLGKLYWIHPVCSPVCPYILLVQFLLRGWADTNETSHSIQQANEGE